MNILGDTLEKIAFEKAGIIKTSVPVVISETQKKTSDVFRTRARETESNISFADQNFTCILDETGTGGERIFIVTDINDGRKYKGISVLGGDYQEKNIKAVFQSFKSMKGIFKITDENIIEGIGKVVKNTGLSGRWQIIGNDPLTICDTGHNREGLEYVVKQLKRIPNTGMHMIMGFVNDKDLSSVLPLLPENATYYFTKASVPRALNEEELKKQAMLYGLKGASYPTVRTAMKAAYSAASSTDLIFVGGSTFIVADAL
jgi:dihydrofolate synthase/folylpolyglutamate synthase